MKYATLAVGALLALAGAAAIWQGWDIVQIERGWTLVISGAVCLAGGVVTMALAALIACVELLRADLGRVRPGKALVRGAPTAIAGRAADASAPTPSDAPGGPVAKSGEALPAAADEPELTWLRKLAQPFAPVAKPNGADAAASPAAKPEAAPPAMLRRFEARGASYTLFADGTIESESPVGRHNFKNMDELRAHLSRLEMQAALVKNA